MVLWPLKAIGLHNYNFPLYRAGFKLRSNNDGDVFHAISQFWVEHYHCTAIYLSVFSSSKWYSRALLANIYSQCTARDLLLTSKPPESFWIRAVDTVLYKRKSVPTSVCVITMIKRLTKYFWKINQCSSFKGFSYQKQRKLVRRGKQSSDRL